MNLANRNIVITGGSSGYGKGATAQLVAAGAHVWITGRHAETLEAAARETGARPLVADVTSGADWDRVFAAVPDLDVLINNAGGGIRIAPMAEQTDDAIIAAINVNLTGALLGAARAARILSAKKSGAIVNVSSVCAKYAWPGWGVYTAAKAGLSKFSHALHTEMRPFGVRVFCLTPSWGQTNFNRAAGIVGASEDAALAAQCMSPDAFGRFVRALLESPDHLAIPDVTVMPMIQDIAPM